MNKFQKVGGISALIEAATFIFGLLFFVTLLIPAGYIDPEVSTIQKIAFLVDNQNFMYLFNFIIYILFGVFLVILSLSLHERLKAGSPAMTQTATVFGLIWAVVIIACGMIANIGAGVVIDLYAQDPTQASSLWLTLNVIVEGLGGGNEIVGGIWILLISWAALRGGTLPKTLNYFGLVVGMAFILTTIPNIPLIDELLSYFGLGSVIWFIWLGIVMLRGKSK